MNDDLFPVERASARPLTALQLAALNQAGATSNETRACERVIDEPARARLVACFCEALPDNWRKLRCMVSGLLWYAGQGGGPIGGEILTNGIKFMFLRCEGSNDHRLVFTRLVALVRPDLRKWLAFDEVGSRDANAVLESGWTPPQSVGWMTITPQHWEIAEP